MYGLKLLLQKSLVKSRSSGKTADFVGQLLLQQSRMSRDFCRRSQISFVPTLIIANDSVALISVCSRSHPPRALRLNLALGWSSSNIQLSINQWTHLPKRAQLRIILPIHRQLLPAFSHRTWCWHWPFLDMCSWVLLCFLNTEVTIRKVRLGCNVSRRGHLVQCLLYDLSQSSNLSRPWDGVRRDIFFKSHVGIYICMSPFHLCMVADQRGCSRSMQVGRARDEGLYD